MKALSGQYVNEIISLTVLALMAIALIYGQAGASLPATATSHIDRPPALAAGVEAIIENAVVENAVLHADFAIDVDFATIARFVDRNAFDGASPRAIRIRFDVDK